MFYSQFIHNSFLKKFKIHRQFAYLYMVSQHSQSPLHPSIMDPTINYGYRGCLYLQ